jgi:hypothetical protein
LSAFRCVSTRGQPDAGATTSPLWRRQNVTHHAALAIGLLLFCVETTRDWPHSLAENAETGGRVRHCPVHAVAGSPSNTPVDPPPWLLAGMARAGEPVAVCLFVHAKPANCTGFVVSRAALPGTQSLTGWGRLANSCGLVHVLVVGLVLLGAVSHLGRTSCTRGGSPWRAWRRTSSLACRAGSP